MFGRALPVDLVWLRVYFKSEERIRAQDTFAYSRLICFWPSFYFRLVGMNEWMNLFNVVYNIIIEAFRGFWLKFDLKRKCILFTIRAVRLIKSWNSPWSFRASKDDYTRFFNEDVGKLKRGQTMTSYIRSGRGSYQFHLMGIFSDVILYNITFQSKKWKWKQWRLYHII